MTTERLPHQKKIKTMGICLAVLSIFSLIMSLLVLPVISTLISFLPEIDDLHQNRWRMDFSNKTVENGELMAKMVLGEEVDITGWTDQQFQEELYKAWYGKDLAFEEGLIQFVQDEFMEKLPEGLTPETTIRELFNLDYLTFQENTGKYRLFSIAGALFHSVIAFLTLKMALAWKRTEPFGPHTIKGLRYIGILFIGQFALSRIIGPFVYSPYRGVPSFSAIQDYTADILFYSGSSLWCGIVLLTLSWVLEHGMKLQQEQALTI